MAYTVYNRTKPTILGSILFFKVTTQKEAIKLTKFLNQKENNPFVWVWA
jgi:hypothetical protein